MSEAILVAIITGIFAFLGTALTVWSTSKKTQSDAKAAQAVMENRIDELTREVRLHNGFAEKIPVLTERVDALNERVKGLESK